MYCNSIIINLFVDVMVKKKHIFKKQVFKKLIKNIIHLTKRIKLIRCRNFQLKMIQNMYILTCSVLQTNA